MEENDPNYGIEVSVYDARKNKQTKQSTNTSKSLIAVGQGSNQKLFLNKGESK
jgi:hypothetical protein